MAGRAGRHARDRSERRRRSFAPVRWLRRQVFRACALVLILFGLSLMTYRVVAPPTTQTIWSEAQRLGGVERTWVPMDDIAPVMARSVVAAEDAGFCGHWGFDMAAIRAAVADGAARGGSTISQQVAKNVYLWQARSWWRKGLEALVTPAIEAAWPKRRILEIYLNVAEFGEGIFGVEAAARHYFGVSAMALTADQAARLATILPNPKRRDPTALSARLGMRKAVIADGAVVIGRDGRAACFERE